MNHTSKCSLATTPTLGRNAILPSPMGIIQAELTMVAVPVGMGTDLLSMETGVFCTKLPRYHQVTRDPRERPY